MRAAAAAAAEKRFDIWGRVWYNRESQLFGGVVVSVSGIFDSHTHYDSREFDGCRDRLLDRMLGSGSPVCGVLHAATDEGSMRFGIEYAKRYERFYTSVGFHPEYAPFLPDDPKGILEDMLTRSDKICAVGEVGLDYHYEGYDREVQLCLLRMQIELAEKHGLPLIFHCRNATEDFMALMREYRPKGVVHCFSGSAETARELTELGLYLGFGGVLTFKNSKRVKKAFAAVPQERLLFETDCPYMAPEPLRGQVCDSFMIAHTAECGAEIRETTAQELTDAARKNTLRLFGISLRG